MGQGTAEVETEQVATAGLSGSCFLAGTYAETAARQRHAATSSIHKPA